MDQTFTDAEFRQNIRKFVGIETGDANTLSLDKQDLQLKVGEITRYYICEDMVWVNLRDQKSTWKCYISHIVHQDANINYVPEGLHKTDKNGLDYLVPDNKIMGLVCAINGDYNTYGAILLGYVGFDDSNHPLNPRENTFKIQIGSTKNNYRLKITSNGLDIKNENGTVISVNDYNIALKTEHLLINNTEYNFKSIIKDLEYCKNSIFELNNKLKEKSENIKNIIEDLNNCKNSILNIYNKSEIDNKVSQKADKNHTHNDEDITITTTNYGANITQKTFNSYLSYDMIQVKNDFNNYYTKTEIDNDLLSKLRKCLKINVRTQILKKGSTFQFTVENGFNERIKDLTTDDIEISFSLDGYKSAITGFTVKDGLFSRTTWLSGVSNMCYIVKFVLKDNTKGYILPDTYISCYNSSA